MKPPKSSRPTVAAALCVAALFLVGCAHPSAFRLPSTAAVAKPIAAAATYTAKAAASNARAVKLARAAVTTGIKAGSAQAEELAADTQETGNELAEVKLQLAAATAAIDQLTAQLLEAQQQVDALAAHDRAMTSRLDVTTKVLKETAVELKAARQELSQEQRHAFEDEAVITLIDLVAIVAAGAALQAILRGLLSAALTLLVAGWHFAWTLILRLLSLAAAV